MRYTRPQPRLYLICSSFQSFIVDEDVRQVYGSQSALGAEKEANWNAMFAAYGQQFGAEAAEYSRRMAGDLPVDWLTKLPNYNAPVSDYPMHKGIDWMFDAINRKRKPLRQDSSPSRF